MQKIVEFNVRNFWTNNIDSDALNAKIAQYNTNGWVVTQVTPVVTLMGFVCKYVLLLEQKS